MSAAERAFAAAWKLYGDDDYEVVREHRFHPTRRWRFDFCWPSKLVALEIDGRGRHQTPKGVRDDCEKLAAACALGWRVLRFPATDKHDARLWVESVMDALVWEP